MSAKQTRSSGNRARISEARRWGRDKRKKQQRDQREPAEPALEGARVGVEGRVGEEVAGETDGAPGAEDRPCGRRILRRRLAPPPEGGDERGDGRQRHQGESVFIVQAAGDLQRQRDRRRGERKQRRGTGHFSPMRTISSNSFAPTGWTESR